jgi:hypothetical protein
MGVQEQFLPANQVPRAFNLVKPIFRPAQVYYQPAFMGLFHLKANYRM